MERRGTEVKQKTNKISMVQRYTAINNVASSVDSARLARRPTTTCRCASASGVHASVIGEHGQIPSTHLRFFSRHPFQVSHLS